MGDTIHLRRILVATDFSDASATALTYGRVLAQRFSAELHVVSVVDDLFRVMGMEGYVTNAGGHYGDTESTARTLLNAALRSVGGGAATVTTALLKSLAPAPAIAQYARAHDIDLVIAGSHGHSGLAHRLVGGVAEQLMALAPCPVLIVKPGEHEFVATEADGARTGSEATRRS